MWATKYIRFSTVLTRHRKCKSICAALLMSVHTSKSRAEERYLHSGINFKPRPKTRKPAALQNSQSCNDENICVTYATAEEYKFQELKKALSTCQHLTEIPLQNDIAHASCFKVNHQDLLRNNTDGYIYFFREGALSFWNIKDSQIERVIELVKPFQVEPYSKELVVYENEKMDYLFAPGPTKFQKNHFVLSQSDDMEKLVMEMYALTNALVVSVKLAHWEHSLDQLIESIQTLPNELIIGIPPSYRSSKSILRKIGQVFQIRHRVNLQNNLLEVPDEYWDHEELESLFLATTQFLNISKRVRIMNEKLSYCAHMVELVKSHLAEQKSIRIELLIVLLILIEVIFEIIHYFVTPYYKDNNHNSADSIQN